MPCLASSLDSDLERVEKTSAPRRGCRLDKEVPRTLKVLTEIDPHGTNRIRARNFAEQCTPIRMGMTATLTVLSVLVGAKPAA